MLSFTGSKLFKSGYLALAFSKPCAKVSASSFLMASFNSGFSFKSLKPFDTARLPALPPKKPSANFCGSKPVILPFSSVSSPAKVPLAKPVPMCWLACKFLLNLL